MINFENKTNSYGPLVDGLGRVHTNLRLSVTDRCNYRCVYCMDPDFRYMPKRQLLSLEDYVTIVRVCAGLGVQKVRLTGGEPTLYPHLGDLISAIGELPFRDVAMTTNGSLLRRDTLRRWVAGGLTRVTFSLDSLRPDRVQRITRSQTSPETVIKR